jgi:glycosyltransferase involved in cell wall biosynthesis
VTDSPQTERPAPLRVLHVVWWGRVGGIALNLVDLASHCGLHAHEMQVCVLTRSGPVLDSLARRGVPVREIGARSGFDIPAFMRFYQFLRRTELQVVHDHSGSWLAALAIRAGARTARRVHQEHGAINVPRLRSRKRLFYRWGRRLYSRFIAISTKTADDMVAAGVERARVETIANPVDAERFSPRQSRESAKRALGVPAAALTIGTACRLVPEKDLDLFLDVARRIHARRADVRFPLVGEGPELERLRRRAAEWNIAAAVLFLGVRDDMPTVWRAFDLYLFTSRIEPFGRTLLESLASETPVVAAVPIVGGGIDIVRDSPGIVSVADRDPDALAAHAVRLLDAPGLRARTGANGRAWVSARYPVARWVAALDDLYRGHPGAPTAVRKRDTMAGIDATR